MMPQIRGGDRGGIRIPGPDADILNGAVVPLLGVEEVFLPLLCRHFYRRTPSSLPVATFHLVIGLALTRGIPTGGKGMRGGIMLGARVHRIHRQFPTTEQALAKRFGAGFRRARGLQTARSSGCTGACRAVPIHSSH